MVSKECVSSVALRRQSPRTFIMEMVRRQKQQFLTGPVAVTGYNKMNFEC